MIRFRHYKYPETKWFGLVLELDPNVKDNISKILTQHSDSFTSKATEIIGVDPQIASHSLNINLVMKLVIQKRENLHMKGNS